MELKEKVENLSKLLEEACQYGGEVAFELSELKREYRRALEIIQFYSSLLTWSDCFFPMEKAKAYLNENNKIRDKVLKTP